MKRVVITAVLVVVLVVFAVFQIGRCTRHGDTKFFFAAGEAAPRPARLACYVLLALSIITHSLTSGDIWGAAMREAFYDLKCITWATLLLYAATVVLLLPRRPRPAGRESGAS